MDVNIDTAKAAIERITTGLVLDEVIQMGRLKFVRVSVILPDDESVFALHHRALLSSGDNRLPSPHSTVAEALARTVFNRFSIIIPTLS
jgi:hypothetical protein